MNPELVFTSEQKEWFSTKDPLHEFEVRLSLNGMNGVSYAMYQQLLTEWSVDDSYEVSESEYTYVHYDTPDAIKQIGAKKYRLLQGTTSASKNGLYSKTQIAIHDISFLSFRLRLSEAAEAFEPISLPSGLDATSRRRIKRHTFKKQGVQIDFSMVQRTIVPSNEQVTSYEVEVEYVPKSTGSFFDHVYPILVRLVTCMVQPVLPSFLQQVTFFQEEQLVSTMNQLFQRMNGFDMSQRGLSENIKERDLAHIPSYAMTNKLDGERRFIYCTSATPTSPGYCYVMHPYGAYAGKSQRLDIFYAIPHHQTIPVFFIDGEWFQDVFYMFDVVYFDSDRTLLPSDSVSHQERMALIPTINIFPIQKKQFYYGTLEENSQQLQRDQPQWEEFFHKNDGFVFTHKTCSYLETKSVFPHLKYKFSSKLSLDFYVQKSEPCSQQLRDTYPYCYELFSDQRHAKKWAECDRMLRECYSLSSSSLVALDEERTPYVLFHNIPPEIKRAYFECYMDPRDADLQSKLAQPLSFVDALNYLESLWKSTVLDQRLHKVFTRIGADPRLEVLMDEIQASVITKSSLIAFIRSILLDQWKEVQRLRTKSDTIETRSIRVGALYRGIVKERKEYGVFVTLVGRDALLHKSKMITPLTVGDHVMVRISSISNDAKKQISLYHVHPENEQFSVICKKIDEIYGIHPYGLLKRGSPLEHPIVECLWTMNEWLMLRPRFDKMSGNRYNVVRDVFDDMKSPLTLPTMFPFASVQPFVHAMEVENQNFIMNENKATRLNTMYHLSFPMVLDTFMNEFHIDPRYRENIALILRGIFSDQTSLGSDFNIPTDFHACLSFFKSYLAIKPSEFTTVYSDAEKKEWIRIQNELFPTYSEDGRQVFDINEKKFPWFDARLFQLFRSNQQCIAKHGYALPISPNALPQLQGIRAPTARFSSKVGTDSFYKSFVTLGEASEYSCLKQGEIRDVNNAFRKWIVYPLEVQTIVDATAHIGVDTIHMSMLFPNATITAFEVTPHAYLALTKNIETFKKTSQITARYQDVTTFVPTSMIDIVYMDPPWGGPRYKESKCLDLYLQKEGTPPMPATNLNYIIDEWMKMGMIRHLVVKVPTNFNQSYLMRRYKVDSEIIHNSAQGNRVVYELLHIQPTLPFLVKPQSKLTVWSLPYCCESYDVIFKNTQAVIIPVPEPTIANALSMTVSYFINTPFSFHAPRLLTEEEIRRTAIANHFVNHTRFTFQGKTYDIWKNILPEEVNMLKDMKWYHNIEKRNLISYYAKQRSVLDLGSGYGGDLAKYEDADVSRLYLVEPDEFNMVTLKSRLDVMNASFREKITLIHAFGQDESIIVPYLDKPVDLVSSFFSLTFLFQSKDRLGAFLDTVVHSLMEGGYFIGTMMEGSKTFSMLESVPIDDTFRLGTDITIKKQYANGPPAFGMGIDIHIANSIVKSQTEYLAFFSLLEEELTARECILVKRKEFTPSERMSPVESTFSALNTAFVFQYRPSRVHGVISRADINVSYEFRNLFQETQSFIRTGVPHDLSFFHSYLYNTSEKYRMHPEDRIAMAQGLSTTEMTLDGIPAFMEEHHTNIYLMDTETRRPMFMSGYKVSRPHSIIMTHFPDHSMEPVAIIIHDIAYRFFPPFDPILSHLHREMKRDEKIDKKQVPQKQTGKKVRKQ